MKGLIEQSEHLKLHGSNSGMSFVVDIPEVEPQPLLEQLEGAGVKITPVSTFAVNGEDFRDLYLLSFSKLGDLELENGIRLIENTITKLKEH